MPIRCACPSAAHAHPLRMLSLSYFLFFIFYFLFFIFYFLFFIFYFLFKTNTRNYYPKLLPETITRKVYIGFATL